jgi:hypothetical protein
MRVHCVRPVSRVSRFRNKENSGVAEKCVRRHLQFPIADLENRPVLCGELKIKNAKLKRTAAVPREPVIFNFLLWHRSLANGTPISRSARIQNFLPRADQEIGTPNDTTTEFFILHCFKVRA